MVWFVTSWIGQCALSNFDGPATPQSFPFVDNGSHRDWMESQNLLNGFVSLYRLTDGSGGLVHFVRPVLFS